MKNISELMETISALPTTFASEAGLSSEDFPTTGEDVSLEFGFPSGYSVAMEGRKDILRDDMNRFGMLATRELHYKQSGGVHTFPANSESNKYSKKILLAYWDEYFLKTVESQYAENDLNFVNIPECIDNLYEKETGDGGKVWWKTAGYIYGIDKNLVTAGGNFSKPLTIPVAGVNEGEVGEDGLVSIGDYIYGQPENSVSFEPVILGDQVNNMIATMQITLPNGTSLDPLSLPNKGRNGSYIVYEGIGLWWKVFPALLCGNSNFDLCFFAKKGTKISVSITDNAKGTNAPKTKRISYITYYPLKAGIKEEPDDE